MNNCRQCKKEITTINYKMSDAIPLLCRDCFGIQYYETKQTSDKKEHAEALSNFLDDKRYVYPELQLVPSTGGME